MQGHLAAFSMDPSFLDGRVEVMYVVMILRLSIRSELPEFICMIALILFELSA